MMGNNNVNLAQDFYGSGNNIMPQKQESFYNYMSNQMINELVGQDYYG